MQTKYRHRSHARTHERTLTHARMHTHSHTCTPSRAHKGTGVERESYDSMFSNKTHPSGSSIDSGRLRALLPRGASCCQPGVLNPLAAKRTNERTNQGWWRRLIHAAGLTYPMSSGEAFERPVQLREMQITPSDGRPDSSLSCESEAREKSETRRAKTNLGYC